jgi:predicted ATP-binding protein involved in virulence
MRIVDIELKNIGPFSHESIIFMKDDNPNDPQVTIITGDNGSGKTIILDAIRYLLYGRFDGSTRSRNIVSDQDNFRANLSFTIPSRGGIKKLNVISSQLVQNSNAFLVTGTGDSITSHINYQFSYEPIWFFDYWTSKLSNDTFSLSTFISPDVKKYLHASLSGVHLNIEVSQWIVYFDYLKSSDSESERTIGIQVFNAIKDAVSIAITGGDLSHVSRIDFQPIIKLNGKELTLDKLSSGNMYVLQRLLSLIAKAYSVVILNGKSSIYTSIFDVPGVLLIDEVENHLHPKWQKVILANIKKLFPKLQVIVTTHSPFIISSIPDANIYVCKTDADGSHIIDETDVYSNKPIDEILTTELFNTLPFNTEISTLMEKRVDAINKDNRELQSSIENKLIKINPQYFSYFSLDEQLKSLYKK